MILYGSKENTKCPNWSDGKMTHYFELSKILEVESERKAALESFKYFGFVVVENVVDP